MGEEIGRERAERDDVGVGEIDLHQHAVDQGQPECDQHVEAAEHEPVDALLQGDRQHGASLSMILSENRFPLFGIMLRFSSSQAPSTTGRRASPYNGWCPS